MIRRGRRAGPAPLPMVERFAQAYRAGQVVLDPFTQAELDCVTLDPQAVLADARGSALQAVTPLLAQLAAERDSASDAGVSPADPAAAAAAAAGRAGADGALAAAAARLERLGYIRLGVPAPPDLPVPDEFAGWSRGPAGEPRPVAIAGDLGIITRMRSQPYLVAEVSASPQPTQRDPAATRWRLVGRMYAAYRPQAGLVERPAGHGGRLLPYVLLWEGSVLLALASWCGVDLEKFQDRRPGEDSGLQLPDAPTAELAGRFASLAQLRVAHSYGQRVMLSTLLVASGEGGHWLLEGERGERAVHIPVVELGNRVAALLRAPAEQADPGAGQDGWPSGEEAW